MQAKLARRRAENRAARAAPPLASPQVAASTFVKRAWSPRPRPAESWETRRLRELIRGGKPAAEALQIIDAEIRAHNERTDDAETDG